MARGDRLDIEGKTSLMSTASRAIAIRLQFSALMPHVAGEGGPW